MSYSNSGWKADFLTQTDEAGITVEQLAIGPVSLWRIASDDWQRFAQLALQHNLRWAAGWAEQARDWFLINACFEREGRYVLLRTRIHNPKPELPSQATVYPAASRSERHTQDMFGVNFAGHPDNRPWTRHKAWPKTRYPLRKDFPVQGEPEAVTPPDRDYAFVKAYGAGVYEIPVGPVHAGIIEPGHFRFQAMGETILNLEERLGYTHKGIEKIAEGRTPEQLARLAGRVSGDTTVGHCWAACMAMERAADIDIPPRAALIRGILAERERVANHLGDMGAICNDVGFAFAHMQFARLRELWLRCNEQLFGHRLLMDRIVPGGVDCDVSEQAGIAIKRGIYQLKVELGEVLPALDLNSSLEDRLYTAGLLPEAIAAAFGALGFVGRASGQFIDLLEPGDLRNAWKTPEAGSEGLGIVEGWRGEIITYIRFDAGNTIVRCYPRDPSLLNWPVLEKLVLDNIVPDFPVCNKSVNGSYSGHDL